MSKAGVLALVGTLARGQADATTAEAYYGDVMVDIAKLAIFNGLQIVPASRGVADYVMPAQMSQLLAIFYDDRMLSLTTQSQLEAISMQWRDRVGHPVAYLIEDLSRHAFRLYPTPVADGGPVIPLNGAPFGLDYPVDTLAVMGSEVRTDLPDWMDLPLALIVLAKEFNRDSPHMDAAYATACQTLATLLLSMAA